MAGESPDKVEKRKSSGETTESDDAVASAAGENAAAHGAGTPDAAHDGATTSADVSGGDDGDGGAEDSKDRPAGKGGKSAKGGKGDARLKAAVEAWVAGADEPEAGDAESATDGDESPGKTGQSAGGSPADGSSDGPSSSDLPVRPTGETEGGADKGAKSDGKAGADGEAEDGGRKASGGDAPDNPTRMFGVLRRDADGNAVGSDEEAAARRAERMTNAFFGSGKRSPESAPDDDSEGSGDAGGSGDAAEAEESVSAEEAADSGGGAERSGEGSDTGRGAAGGGDQPTATFRIKNGSTGKGAGAEDAAASGAVDQPTAVFRAVTPGKAAAGAEASEDAGEAAESAESDAGDGAVDDPRVPHARDADKDPEQDEAEAAAAAGGTAESAEGAKVGAEEGSDAAGESDDGSEESDSERTSQFVPLRSADLPQRPPRKPAPVVPPKPLGKPHADAQETGAQPLPEAQDAEATSVQAPLSEADLTRQQPRPDQAPLDLLAQLTNTPPPAETPMRTAVRRVKIWTPFVLLLAIVFVVVQAARPLPASSLSLTASPHYTFSGSKPAMPWPTEGQAKVDVQGLGSFGSAGTQKPVPIASVAKVMTAYVILRDHPVKKGSKGASIPVDKKAEDEAGLSAQNESTVDVKKGDTLSEKEAMQAIMIASANNVARLLARWDAGSEKAFTKKMNSAARELGMTHSKYTDPSGLTASTVSTANDQVKLAKKVMNVPLFRGVVRMPSYTDGNHKQHANWNKLVPLNGVVGIKTGTTTKAGGNLLFAAEKNVDGTKQLVVGAVLGQHKPSILDTVLGVSKKLITAAQGSLRSHPVVHKGQVVGYVDDQLGGKTPVVATRDASAVGWSGLRVKLGLDKGGKAVPHEAKAGEKVGALTVGDGPGQVRVPVALQKDMTEPSFGSKLTRIL